MYGQIEPYEVNGYQQRLVLVGLERVGKSAAGNTLLGRKEFETGATFTPLTLRSESRQAEVCGNTLTVVDTPGLLNSRLPEEEMRVEMEGALSLCAPGPHAFLLVIQLGRFTERERKVMEALQEMMGADVRDYTMVLFTYGDRLEQTNIEHFIGEDKNVEKLLQQCGGRYHVFNNNIDDATQVRELLDKIQEMSGNDKGQLYNEKNKCREDHFWKKGPEMANKNNAYNCGSKIWAIVGGVVGLVAGLTTSALSGSMGAAVGAAIGTVTGSALGAATGAAVIYICNSGK